MYKQRIANTRLITCPCHVSVTYIYHEFICHVSSLRDTTKALLIHQHTKLLVIINYDLVFTARI
jgi:hypothetical protein